MAPLPIIEDLDVVEDICTRQITGFIDSFFDSLLFQAAQDRFDNGIFPAIATTTHAWLKVVDFAKAQPVITTVL